MARMKEYPGNLHLSSSDLMMRVDLHSTVGGSDKVYILTVLKHKSNGTYQVVCYNGRRGHGLTTQNYSTHASFPDAKSDLRTRQRAKESKGYKFMHDEEATPNGTVVSAPGQVNRMTMNPNLSAGIQVQRTAPGLKTAVQPIATGTMTKLASFKTPFPQMKTTDAATFLRIIKKDDYVMFNLPTMRLHYAFLENADWVLYDLYDHTKRPTPEFFPVDPTNGSAQGRAQLQGLGWIGVTDNAGQFIITDLACVPGVPDVYKKPWKSRRAMMGLIYDQLYPGVDPYDITNKLRFADYIYDDKVTNFNFGNGIFAAYNVNVALIGQFHVSTK